MWQKIRWLFNRNARSKQLREFDTARLESYRTGLVMAMRRERGHMELFILAKELAKVEHILEERGEL